MHGRCSLCHAPVDNSASNCYRMIAYEPIDADGHNREKPAAEGVPASLRRRVEELERRVTDQEREIAVLKLAASMHPDAPVQTFTTGGDTRDRTQEM
jgi:hypothetical protein